jgi:hypothetical protein
MSKVLGTADGQDDGLRTLFDSPTVAKLAAAMRGDA